MLVLGIETSCDETAAAVVEGGVLVRSSVVASQEDLHAEYAGVVPEIAGRAHAERLLPVVREALARAGVGLGMIDAVAVGHRPGLIGCLLVGVSGAKALAWALSKPLIGVDHVHAHLYAGRLVPAEAGCTPPDMTFPALGLVVSGGHTSLYLLRDFTRVTRLGATIDDAMGEAYDKAATILGLPFPGGPNLDRLAQRAQRERAGSLEMVKLPIARLGRESLDFSFSGLKTALLYAARGVPGGDPPPTLTPDRVMTLAASFQQAAVATVRLKLERANEQHGPFPTLLVGGGVSANSLLRHELAAFASSRGMAIHLPELSLCVDNAAMIAGLGGALLQTGHRSDLSLQAVATSAL